MSPMISIAAVTKRYKSGLVALDAVDLEIARGEIFALLGPNGAGKTTLIGVICGTVSMTSGRVLGRRPRRRARLSRRAREWSAWCRRRSRSISSRPSGTRSASAAGCSAGRRIPLTSNNCCATFRCGTSATRRIVELSGGMKRRVMIAKALSHEPDVLFLDEPTAGVDVNLRRDMWALVRRLRERGRHHHSHDPLHRGGRGDGGPGRRHQQRPDRAGRGEGSADAQARQAAADAHAAEANAGVAEANWPAGRSNSRTTATASPTASTRRPRTPAFPRCLRRLGEIGVDFKDLEHQHDLARGHFRRSGGAARREPSRPSIASGVWAIYRYEMARTQRTILAERGDAGNHHRALFRRVRRAIGARIREVSGVSYGAFIVPGLIMLSLLTQSISNASIGIYFPKFTGTIFEILSAPLSSIGGGFAYVGAAATKSIAHRPHHSRDRGAVRAGAHRAPVLDDRLPRADRGRLQPVRLHHRHLGEKLRAARDHPALVVTPLTFLGGAFYSIDMLPPFWRAVSLFNPVVYLISGFRWSFYGQGDVSVAASLGFTALFIAACLAILTWIFRTGWRLKP